MFNTKLPEPKSNFQIKTGGHKDTIRKELKSDIAFDVAGLPFGAYLSHTGEEGFLIKAVSAQAIKARYRIFEFDIIGAQKFLMNEEFLTIDLNITVWGEVKLEIYGKAIKRTKEFYTFIDCFIAEITKRVKKALDKHKEINEPKIDEFLAFDYLFNNDLDTSILEGVKPEDLKVSHPEIYKALLKHQKQMNKGVESLVKKYREEKFNMLNSQVA